MGFKRKGRRVEPNQIKIVSSVLLRQFCIQFSALRRRVLESSKGKSECHVLSGTKPDVSGSTKRTTGTVVERPVQGGEQGGQVRLGRYSRRNDKGRGLFVRRQSPRNVTT